jgi:hypothetical protein
MGDVRTLLTDLLGMTVVCLLKLYAVVHEGNKMLTVAAMIIDLKCTITTFQELRQSSS